MAKKKKVRVDLRKNRSKPPRPRQWTRGYQEHGFAEEGTVAGERVRAKGELSRKRTIIQEETRSEEGGQGAAEMPAVNVGSCLAGRVLRVHGLSSVVMTEDGRLFRCAVRRLLKTLASEERNVVAAGDRVWIRPAGPGQKGSGTFGRAGPEPPEKGSGTFCAQHPSGRSGKRFLTPFPAAEGAAPKRFPTPFSPAQGEEGFIQRVEPRHGLLTRASRGREHVLVANVDQVVFVLSLVEPDLKPHLIDRYLASAEQGGIAPVLCLNKADLVDPADYQPLVGFYSQLGIPTLLTSAATGLGVERLQKRLHQRETVFSGQSGVGKSSLLNAIQPGLGLRVREVSETTQKGRHTTTTAELIALDRGGWVVDTPGLRQFELWDIIPEEVEGFFAEFRPYVPLCPFPDCTHTHEERCAIKEGVRQGYLSERRYLSYLGMFAGKDEG